MKLGTRLLVLLLPIVAGIMTLSGLLALEARQASLTQDTQLETQAYARALGVAFDHAFQDVQHENVQAIINQVSEAPSIYGILVYDHTGHLLFTSTTVHRPTKAPAEMLRRVLRNGGDATFVRTLEEQRVFSVLRALHGPGGTVTGALEVAQPLSPIEQEIARSRWRYLLTTVALLTAISLITLAIVRRTITGPLGHLVEASQAIGAGHLTYRIDTRAAPGELAKVADAFNGMAQGLAQTQAAMAHEAEERLQLERRLRESEKMAAIGGLAAGLAHEIAAPLNVISGRAEMLLKRVGDAPERERQLRIIVQQITRITTIVRNLLDFARQREVRRGPVELGAVLQGVNELLEEEFARAGARLDYRAPAPRWIAGDPDLLHQVFVNLYLNALQAMEAADGERRLTVRLFDDPDSAPDGAADGSTPAPPRTVVEVRDTGPGLAPELVGNTFTPFVTTKARGTGLGLVVAQRIVQEHGGELVARNADPGPGAILQVRFPGLPA